jgi:hypothetical protein
LIGFGWFIDSWVMIGFGFFMGFRVRTIQNQYNLRKELKEEDINYKTTYNLLSNKDFARIKEVLLSHTPALRSYIDQVSEDVSDPLMASQVNNVLVSPIHKDTSILFKIVIIALWFGSLSIPIIFMFNYDFFVANYEWWFEYLSGR